MSRLTGADAKGLMEAYNAVYAPQELTEEQVWEEVENWVNSLVEEGYDLSEYTWEEMYESYLEEIYGTNLGGNTKTKPNKLDTAVSNVVKSITSSGADATPRTTGIYGQPTRKPTPAARPAAAAPAARPAAAAPAARPAAAAPAARPGAKVASKPAVTPSGGSALDRATAAASKPAAFSPKPQSDVGAMIARSQARQTAQTPTPAAKTTPAAKQSPRQARLNMEMEYDTFDTVLEYLVSEGYADTEESALVIMANMSEEWRQSIVEGEENKEDSQKPFTGEGPKKPKGWRPTGRKLKTGQRPGYAR